MPCSPVVPAEFLGVSTATLQTWLTQTQQAIQDLTTGGKAEIASYTQGDGAKSVTFTRAQLPYLQARAQTLADLLNPGAGYRRRPMRPLYLP